MCSESKFSSKFIVLDGPDGCGKSTQSKMLSEWIRIQGTKVHNFRDPGTTAIGEKIRDILLDTANDKMDVRCEVLLYMAARAQLWHENIKSAIDDGECVVMDRWLSSTCAYQGYAGGFGVERVIELADVCLERTWPDVIIVLDVDLDTAAARMKRTLDRMEQKGGEYHGKVRDGFLELAEKYPGVHVVDASKDAEWVHKQVVSIVDGI